MSELRPTIHLFHHLARTGGTLLSRCLATMDGTTLLSEINPRGHEVAAQFDPLFQAQYWFKLFNRDEVQLLRDSRSSFAEILACIALRVAENGERLVLRDWSHLDFHGKPFAHPTFELTLTQQATELCDVHQAASVRHPALQWLSWERFQPGSGLSLEQFMEGCRRFAEQAVAMGFVRYEDFTANPDGVLRSLCEMLALPFDEQYAYRWYFYRNVCGDIGNLDRYDIQPVPTPTIDVAIRQRLEANRDYRETLELLGYTTDLDILVAPTDDATANEAERTQCMPVVG